MATSQRRARKVMTDERPHRGPSGSAARVTAPENPILVMQRTAGNRAVGRLLERDALTIRRHSSWEHAMIGDTPASKLGKAVVDPKTRSHVLTQEWARLQFFSLDAAKDPRARFPEIKWMQLKGSQLWLSYGELNALADYLPDPATIDTMEAPKMIPVIQRMRQTMLKNIKTYIGFPAGSMEGAAGAGLDWVPGAGGAGEVSALDKATGSLGLQRYQGLLARNACHFAPFSWQRWGLYHAQAREEALKYNGGKCREAPLEDLDSGADEHLRQAWLNNGYGDHFLQDSFAAGHLVNKTLVMQWFAEYVAKIPWWARPSIGLPGKEELERMARLPGVAGQSLYNGKPSSATSKEDRKSGSGPADPQSAQERDTTEGRMAGSGVTESGGHTKESNYQLYLDMLNNAYLQLAAGAAHDWFNEHGLFVENERGDKFQVGGDDTLLAKSGPIGAELAGEAAEMSRTAITELLTNGITAITSEKILALVPKFIHATTEESGDQKMPLANWQNTVLFELCWKTIFPDVATRLSGEAVRMASSEMVSGGISKDQE